MYWEEINGHMKNKFSSKEKIKTLIDLPDSDKLESIDDNIIYKVQFATIAVDVVNFKKLSKHSDPQVLSLIMSEFVYGVTKILKYYDCKYIDIQGDAVFGTFKGTKKKDLDNVFTAACALDSFGAHIQKMIDKKFPGELSNGNYYNSVSSFEFGIGIFQSWDNYISRMGLRSERELVFMGRSVNYATYLSQLANRSGRKKILMNDLFKSNLTNEELKKINEIGGFSSFYDSEIQGNVHECDWIITGYDNYIKNNI